MPNDARQLLIEALRPKLPGFGGLQDKVAEEVADTALQAIAQWLAEQRNDVPATGEEFASALLSNRA